MGNQINMLDGINDNTDNIFIISKSNLVNLSLLVVLKFVIGKLVKHFLQGRAYFQLCVYLDSFKVKILRQHR